MRRLDDVGIDRALPEKAAVLELARLVGKHVDEGLAYRLALRLWLVEPLERRVEFLRRTCNGKVEPEVLREHLLDLLRLAVAKEPVVDKDAVEPRPYRLVEKDSRNGGVNAAGKPEDNLVVADLGFHLLHGVVYPRRELPVGVRTANVEYEVGDDMLAVLGMHDLGVELDPEEAAAFVAHGRIRAVRRPCAHLEPGRDRRHAVTVAHPDDEFVGKPLEELVPRLDRHLGLAVLALLARLDLAAKLLTHQLHAVADAKDRDAKLEDAVVDSRSPFLEDAVRTAGEDDALRRVRTHLFGGDVERDDFGVDVLLADSPRNELRILRTIV